MKRKKYQRKLNKALREMNNIIAKDKKFKGRFVVHQVGHSSWHVFEDKSGAHLFAQLLYIDKRTSMTMLTCITVTSWSSFWKNKIAQKMSYFITTWIKAFLEEDTPIDFTEVGVKINRDMKANSGWSVIISEKK